MAIIKDQKQEAPMATPMNGPLSLDLEYADDARTPENYRFRINRAVLRGLRDNT